MRREPGGDVVLDLGRYRGVLEGRVFSGRSVSLSIEEEVIQPRVHLDGDVPVAAAPKCSGQGIRLPRRYLAVEGPLEGQGRGPFPPGRGERIVRGEPARPRA